jgi:succinate dehydrogenase / fumarate reductase cytochrome b subunit
MGNFLQFLLASVYNLRVFNLLHKGSTSVITKSRPIHLNLLQMKFPPMAIVSIMHRISGVLLFLLLPLMLYILHHSLSSQASFVHLQLCLTMPITELFLWVFICAAAFHFFAGERHMVMDCGWGESLNTARNTAYLIFVLEIIVMIGAGVWLW